MAELKNAFTKDDAYANLERINGWISNCDTKASILFGVLGVVIGLTTEVFKVFGFLKDVATGAVAASSGNIALLVFQLLLMTTYMVATAFAVYNLVNVLKARLRSPIQPKMLKDSMLYFDMIANKTQEQYLDTCSTVTEEKLVEDINTQVWVNSLICKAKFKYYKRSLIWVCFAGVFAVMMLVLINLI